MNRKLPHLFLKNPFGSVNKFIKSRYVDPKVKDKDPLSYRPHKQKLNASYGQLIEQRKHRISSKNLISENIDIVEIRFLIPFNENSIYKIRARFVEEFGLCSVMQKDFNRTVLFAIIDNNKFDRFDRLLKKYIESEDTIAPQGTDYAIMTTLFDVKYHTAEDRRNFCSHSLVFELINNNEFIFEVYESQRLMLIEYLDELVRLAKIESYTFDVYEKMIQIKEGNKDTIDELVRNFDILAKAHSLRHVTVRPDRFNVEQLNWNLTILKPKNVDTLVGIIDNGIRPIQPIEQILFDGIDITPSGNAFSAKNPHGTAVASLAAVGDRFFNGDNELIADALVFSIKILEDKEGYLDIIKILESIREIHRRKGIRLFNLSVCGQSKSYNESPSHFAYLLDKLAYEEDILIFIAAGNISYEDVVCMHAENEDLNNYPNHFYRPEAKDSINPCEFTNICIPAESINNITVGALAENFRKDTPTGLSLDKNLPAYYSRKGHYDFKQVINGTRLSHFHSNKNLFKPDIVMPGGDYLSKESAMQILGFGEFATDFYAFEAGTSLATPIALNLAVQLLNIYPNISLQSVKALLINSANSYTSKYLEENVNKRKDKLAIELYGTPFVNLDQNKKTNISKSVQSAEDIHRNLVGYGMPVREKLLYSSDAEVSILIEDSIPSDHHKVVFINIPEYLLETTNSKCVDIQATLCFKSNPAWGNHTDYNPLHISFNFANSIIKDSLDELAEIISDRNHTIFEDYWNDEIRHLQNKMDMGNISEVELEQLSKLKNKIKDEALGVRKKLDSWSEDYFPLVNKPLSNRQQMKISLAKQDLKKIGNQLVIVFRCAIKENLDVDLKEWARTTTEHPFSLAVRISDISKHETDRNLYDELQTINNLEIIANNIVDIHQDLQAEF